MIAAPGARIGPNAIIQVADALERRFGRDAARSLFGLAGLAAYVDAPPQAMVPEDEVIALHRTLRENLAPQSARGIARAAGRATGDYLLAHRIPRAVQLLLRNLPARLASRLLLNAIRRHAWTFAGSARFTARAGRPVRISIGNCPICRAAEADTTICDYYAATFTRLYSRLVHRTALARETACAANGDPQCQFEIDWDGAWSTRTVAARRNGR